LAELNMNTSLNLDQSADSLSQKMSVVDMVWPDQCNHHGTLFGGAALSMLDRLAFIMGSKVLRGSVVTAAVNGLDFSAPAPAGHLVQCDAYVVKLGKRSVTIQTELVSEDLLTGVQTKCLSGEFVMVTQNSTLTSMSANSESGLWGKLNQKQLHPVVRVAEIVFPGHTNHRGTLHGGPAMGWLAKAAFVAATRCVRKTVVLASSERIDFVAPALVGDVVEVLAQVSHVGNRSITIDLELWSESPVTGERRFCTSTRLVYVSVHD